MKAVNILLAVVVSVLMAGLVLEGGLRLLRMGPPDTGLQFDPRLGWALQPNHEFTNVSKGNEFRAVIETDAHGLRDDYHGDAHKPEGTFRVVCLGDSFTLGFTVQRHELFVDLLEHWWTAEGRKVEVVNAGVQAYSTDQQLAWLEEHGAEWQPDLVLMFPYENDLYWNLKDAYARSSKPVYDDRGARVSGELEDHMTRSFLERTAIGNALLRGKPKLERYTLPEGEQILAEQTVLLAEPPSIAQEAERRTSGIMHQAGSVARKLGAKFVVCPIPSHSQVDERYAKDVMGAKVLRIPREAWDPAAPYAMLRRAAETGSEHVLDPLPALAQAEASGAEQYHRVDWHLSPTGNRTLAAYLHTELDALNLLPGAATQAALEAPRPKGKGLPGWLPVFGTLWLLLGTLYSRTYRDESAAASFLKVGGLLAMIFTIAIGGSALIGRLPAQIAQITLIAVIIAILGFVAFKMGNKVLTAFELLKSFTARGHWYLMPLLAVLVTVGSLLVVAASSPLVAPFIYTLF